MLTIAHRTSPIGGDVFAGTTGELTRVGFGGLQVSAIWEYG